MGNSSKIGIINELASLILNINSLLLWLRDSNHRLAGAIYYRYEFIRSETRPTAQLSYTNILSNSNAISMVTEIGFVTLTLAGFGMLSYIIANKLDRLSEFNQS
jgi:hypothetical protein